MLRRTDFFHEQDTASYLGHASKRMYAYVRHELGVPFHQGFVENPLPSDAEDGGINGRAKKTIGSWISIVYEALRSGDMHPQIMGCLEAREMNGMWLTGGSLGESQGSLPLTGNKGDEKEYREGNADSEMIQIGSRWKGFV